MLNEKAAAYEIGAVEPIETQVLISEYAPEDERETPEQALGFANVDEAKSIQEKKELAEQDEREAQQPEQPSLADAPDMPKLEDTAQASKRGYWPLP